MRRPMRRAYAGNYLDLGMSPPVPLPTNVEVTRFLSEAALADLGGVPVTESTPEGDERIARMMAAEAVAALNRREGRSSAGWYTSSIRSALSVAGLMFPELESDDDAATLGRGFEGAADARCIFFLCLAITSQNNTVQENVRYALEQYRHFKDHGALMPKVYGQKGASIAMNLRRANDMLDVFGGSVAKLRDFLDTTFTMRDVRDAAAAHGIRVGGRELSDEPVKGSMIFGPKIGNGFYQNLVGNHANVTFDLWWMRSWGRYTGTLLKGQVTPAQVERLSASLAAASREDRDMLGRAGVDLEADHAAMAPDELVAACRPLAPAWEGMRKRMVERGMGNPEISALKAEMGWPGAAEAVMKGLARSVDQPENAGDRRWMRSVVGRALDMLAVRGYRMSAADLQATLWYPERSLYAALSGRKADHANVSFEEALSDAALKEGHDDESVWRARGHAGRVPPVLGDDGPGGRGGDGPAPGGFH